MAIGETPRYLSAGDLLRLCEFLYRRTGMLFGETKRYYIDRRVADRVAATGVTSFASYFNLLLSEPGEAERLINSFTVNETYFYREEHQLRCLSRSLLPDRIIGKQPGDRIRVWSVPCSTGEEPYSIAIWLLENWNLVDAYNVEIVGSDIDSAVLRDAAFGEYGKRSVARLSSELRQRYFERLDDDRWRIIQDLRESVSFRAANLIDRERTGSEGEFDIIFCRNVLIYFDDESRRRTVDNLYDALLPGGYLCLGHTESMSRISKRFEVARFDDAIVYRRGREN
ncbi:protein-glutamate O-methyltransferase CheR [Bosea caraganae]|uniref:protein-glutamate O-methyltransferase n=1 Tax=Bosea caraganae TaxID=2763117 RepID=A0A370L2Z1_9HYPH|nr:protein-glutamate O-methyltransferase CheR [Bosea caraganae]RDJ20852.1 protein-glutamate O-methyltransferase CheR [Bosea caraganae]RDJ22615.1 protein-glutamate O-methyltransferase CheR [Bosea caraganae]